MFDFKIVEKEKVNWAAIEGCYDHNIFKSHEWMEFLEDAKNITLFVLEVYENKTLIGYFIGGKFKKIFTIIASPFEGWATPFQGLSMLKLITVKKRLIIYNELIRYLFSNNLCSFFQVSDMELELPYVAISDYKFNFELVRGYFLDLTPSEDIIYKNMSRSSARDSINKATRLGVKINEPTNVYKYVESYYEQLCDVFRKQGMNPTHNKEFAKGIIEKLYPAGKLLMLEATTAEGKVAASGFWGIDRNKAFYLGGASFRKYQSVCPNEPLICEAIMRLKRLGATQLEFGGPRSYKEKYGPIPYAKPKIIAAKYCYITILKNIAKHSYYLFREFQSKLKKG